MVVGVPFRARDCTKWMMPARDWETVGSSDSSLGTGDASQSVNSVTGSGACELPGRGATTVLPTAMVPARSGWVAVEVSQ